MAERGFVELYWLSLIGWNRVGIANVPPSHTCRYLLSTHQYSVHMYDIVRILVLVRPSNDIRSRQEPPKGNACP